MSTRSKGICRFCGKEYTKSAMIKHLPNCQERKTLSNSKSSEKQSGYLSIAIAGAYRKEYWLMIEIREDSTLKDLDKFLRDIWLECCGHLSSFKIDGVLYDAEPQESMGWGVPAKSMNCKLKSVLEEGMQFEYEYDYGSTTVLSLSVLGYREGGWQKEKLRIMSRNKPIEMLCDECGEKVATVVCSECICEGEGLLCNDCKDTHDCGEEMLMKIANSPRFGVCAYEGSSKYPD